MKNYNEIDGWTRVSCHFCGKDDFTHENPCWMGDREVPFHQKCMKEYEKMELKQFDKYKHLPNYVVQDAIRNGNIKYFDKGWCLIFADRDMGVYHYDTKENMIEWFKENLLEHGRQNGMYDLAYVLHDGKIVKHKVELKLNVKIGD